MKKISLVSVIIPTYNEVENIVELICSIDRVLSKKHEIIVVDDNSPDDTKDVIESLINKNKTNSFSIINRKKNPGLTNSIKDGIKLSKGDVIVWLDADFSMPPKIINKLLEQIEKGQDIAIGSRFMKESRIKNGGQEIFFSKIINKLAQLLISHDLTDWTSGFVAVRRDVFSKIKLNGDYGEYFIDFLAQSRNNKFKIVEVPYSWKPRSKGESKTGQNIWQYFGRGRKYIMTIIKLKFN